MAQRSRFFISFFFFIITGSAMAQVEQDTTEMYSDTTNVYPSVDTTSVKSDAEYADSVAAAGEKFSFSLFADYGKLLTLPFNFERKIEGGFYVRFFRKIAIGAEGGTAYINPQGAYLNGDAESEGIYYGGFIQYFLHLDSYNSIFLGAGYSQGTFDDRMSYTIDGGVYGKSTYQINRSDLKASWTTIRIGSEKMLSRNIGIGGVLEIRIKSDFREPEGLLPVTIPGYGPTDNKSTPALNLYLKFSL